MPPDRLSRRSFLAGSLGAGAVAAGALAYEAYDHRASPPPSTTTTTTTSTTPVRPPDASDWQGLASDLAGDLVLPSSARYASARLLYNAQFSDVHPAGVAYCQSTSDVARCVDFVTTHGLPVAARAGGHSYGGYSSCAGLVIDVSAMHDVAVAPSATTATIGAGAQLIDVYDALSVRGLLLPAGSCPTVGLAGLALGGGVGVFGRRYGLTCDNVRAVHLVTADATTLVADATTHGDLWWASRGGGGGNFGVVTAFEVDVHPTPAISLFTLQFPWAAAATVLSAWTAWVAAAPDELWTNCQLLSQGSDGLLVQVGGVYCGSVSEAASVLATFERTVAATATYHFLGGRDYLSAMAIEAGCSELTIAACHLAGDGAGTLSRSAYRAKSSFVGEALSDAQAAALVAATEELARRAPDVGGGLAFDSYGGAINRVASDASAFVHRDKVAGIQATYSWGGDTAPSVIAAGASWLSYLASEVFDPAEGAYQNYIDPTLANWADAYYGANLAQLRTVKGRYDPENLFNFAQSIPEPSTNGL